VWLAWKAELLVTNVKKTGETAMKCYGTIAALLVILCSAPTTAADKTPGVGTIGTGTFSCGKFSKYDGAPNSSGQMDLVVQWAWGFISAYNTRAAFSPTFQDDEAPNAISPPDANSILSFIRKHCEKNPLSNVTNATLELIGTLGGIVTSSVSFPQTQG
jgi:hypothetical protein